MQELNNKIISESTLKKRQIKKSVVTNNNNNNELVVYEKLIDFLNSKISDWSRGIDVNFSNSIFVNIKDIKHEIPEIVKFHYLLELARKALKKKQFYCYITSDGTFFIGAKNFYNSFLCYYVKNLLLFTSIILNVLLFFFLLISIIRKIPL